jgi:hypothetical protein
VAQINDLMFAALRDAGYAGALADMRAEYLSDLGYSTMRELYEANGFSGEHVSDFAATYWAGAIETAP